MERVYLSSYYLKTLHYLFFSLAVFSLTAGIMLFVPGSLESLSFFGLSFFYCASSLLVAHYFYRSYKELVEPFFVIKLYLLPYLVLVFWTIISVTLLVWIFPVLLGLIYSFLFINYYIFFVIVIGFVASRFKMVSRFFEVYNFYILRKAKNLAKKHAFSLDVGEYNVGSDPRIDELLDAIWFHKQYPLPYVRKLEIALCEKHIIEINRMMNKMRELRSDKDKTVIESLEKMKEGYLIKIKEIEQKVD